MLELTGDRLQVTVNANRRILLWRHFRLGDRTPRYFFDKNGRAVKVTDFDEKTSSLKADEATGEFPTFRLDSESVFAAIRPELRLMVGDNESSMLQIGDGPTLFRPVIKTPSEARGGNSLSMPLLARSHLVEELSGAGKGEWLGEAPNEVKGAQAIGKAIYAELNAHLSAIATFSHPGFAKALSRLLFLYIPAQTCALLSKRKHNISQGALQESIATNLKLRQELIKYLLAVEDDESAIRTQILTELPDDSKIFSKKSDESSIQKDAVVNATSQLKRNLRASSTELQDFLEADDASWAKEMAGTDFHFKVMRVSNGQAALMESGSFFEYYKAYRDSFDWVSRFSRSSPLHAFVNVYLASLFKSHGDGQVPGAAREMAELGIKGQEKFGARRFGDSAASRARRTDEVTTSLGDFKTQLEAADPKLWELLQPHAQRVEEALSSVFADARRFTRSMAETECEELFIALCEEGVEGKFATVLSDFEKATKVKDKEFQLLLSRLQSAKKAVKEATADGEQPPTEQIVEKYAKAAEGLTVDLKACKTIDGAEEAVKKAWNTARLSERLGELKTKLEDNKGQIEDERGNYRGLFRLWLSVGVTARSKTLPGLPGMLVSNETLDSQTLSDAALTELVRTAESEFLAGVAAPAKPETVSVELPSTMQQELQEANLLPGEGQELTMEAKAGGKVVGTARIVPQPDSRSTATPSGESAPSGFDMELKPTDIDAEGTEIAPDDVVLTPVNGSTESEFQPTFHDIDLNAAFPKADPEQTKATGSYGELEKILSALQLKYLTSEDDGFARKVEALTWMQMVLATPTAEANLNALDVSNNTAVINEMLLALGKSPDDTGRLKKVNLSKVFPLHDDDLDEFSNILQHSYHLCKSVNDLKNYLGELKELRDLADALAGSDVELQIVNRPIDDLLSDEELSADVMYPWRTKPALFYHLTDEALGGATGLNKMSSALVETLAEERAENPDLQVPFVFTRGTAPAGAYAFPLHGTEDLKLPTLGDTGYRVAPHIQDIPDILFVVSGLGCVAPLGAVPDSFSPSSALKKRLESRLHKPWGYKGSPDVRDYLRSIWMERLDLCDQLIVVKWINYALLCGIKPGQPLNDLLRPVYGSAETNRDLFDEPLQGLPAAEMSIGTVNHGNPPLAIDNLDLTWDAYFLDGRSTQMSWVSRLVSSS